VVCVSKIVNTVLIISDSVDRSFMANDTHLLLVYLVLIAVLHARNLPLPFTQQDRVIERERTKHKTKYH